MSAPLQPPVWRPSLEILAGAPILLAVKWFVPDGVKVAGDGVSPAVERTKDLIVFSLIFLGSFL